MAHLNLIFHNVHKVAAYRRPLWRKVGSTVESSALVTAWDYLHISTLSLFSFSYQKWTACPSFRAVNTSSSSSSSESSELLITAALRAWSFSRTHRSPCDRKQSAGQINHAAVKVPTLKWGPNGLITICRRLDLGFFVVTRGWRSSFRICCLRSCGLVHLSCSTRTGLEQIQLIWEHEEYHPKSTLPSVSPVFTSSCASCFHAACLSNCRRIQTARQDTDWSRRGTLWSFTVLTYYITAHMWDVTSASCVKLARSEKACC